MKEKWIDARKADVVDAPYFHVVFTVPSELNPLIFTNQKTLYNLLYHCSAETLFELARDRRYLGGEIGFMNILHTWGSNLSYHPHIHAIVLGGGLANDKTFIASQNNFLFPIKVVSKLFRGKFLHGLKKIYEQGNLKFPPSLDMLSYSKMFNEFLTLLYSKEWIPYIKKPFKDADEVIEYLGRYTHRIAISNSRILTVSPESVKFKVKDYKSGANTTLSLHPIEFIRRFLMHVLPKGFVKIRHYGLLSNRSKSKKLALVRQLVGGVYSKPRFKDLSTLEILKEVFGIDPLTCRKCGSRQLQKTPLFHQLE